MAAQQRQPEASSVDISVEKHGDVDVVIHNAPDETHEQLAIDNVERKMETQRQAWFENAIKEKLKIPNSYAEVSVLMVRWHIDLDEYSVGHSEEIKNLKRVFRDRFGFSVGSVVSLDPRKAKPQNTLNLAVAQHIHNHDGANKLMIIYYTGHGALVGAGRRLAFAAVANPAKELKRDPHSIAYWDVAEKQLFAEGVELDVLTILDCCFAGSGHKGDRDSQRTYDLLAACDSDEMTPAPSEGSFTRRLTATLNRLLDEGGDQRILTARLVEEMNQGCEMHAHLYDRFKRDDGRVVQLKPLTKQSKRETKRLASDFKKQPGEEAGVTLRFSLQDSQVSKKKIEDWAKELIRACKAAGISPRRIDWVKMEKNNPGQRLQRLVHDIVSQDRKSSPRRRFQQAIQTVIMQNRLPSSRVAKRPRSTESSPVMPKRRTSDRMLTPLTRSTSRLMTPESNVGEQCGIA